MSEPVKTAKNVHEFNSDEDDDVNENDPELLVNMIDPSLKYINDDRRNFLIDHANKSIYSYILFFDKKLKSKNSLMQTYTPQF